MAVASLVSGLTSSWPLSSLAFWLLPSSSPWELHPLSIDEFRRGHVSYSRDCAASKIFILFFYLFRFECHFLRSALLSPRIYHRAIYITEVGCPF